MADHLYDYETNSSFLHCNIPPSSSDEISLLLNQILYRSSSSSPPPPAKASTTTASVFSQSTPDCSHAPFSKSQRISAVDSFNASARAFFSENVRLNGPNLSSSSIGVCENEANEDHDCESEEGIEAAIDDGLTKAAPRTKRSRAAEVHNLSEKRRRSRINEKMKALQSLIPHSNKTDKASMLDEAIEYLKQLQLQVQMLTMKNGLSLHPMSLPGSLQPFQFSQMRMGLAGENGSPHMITTGTLAVNQETSTQSLFNLPSQCTATNQLQVSNVINSETSFGLDSSIQAQFGPFRCRTSSAKICREDTLPHPLLNVSHSDTNPSDAVLLSFDTQNSGLKDCGSLEACVMARSQPESVHSKNLEHKLFYTSPTLNLYANGKKCRDDFELERRNF